MRAVMTASMTKASVRIPSRHGNPNPLIEAIWHRRQLGDEDIQRLANLMHTLDAPAFLRSSRIKIELERCIGFSGRPESLDDAKRYGVFVNVYYQLRKVA